MTTNYQWAGMVLADAGLPVTVNNEANIVRWMDAENPDYDWWWKNNPLNVADFYTDSNAFPDLESAAEATAKVILQNNMYLIAAALRGNDSLPAFSAAVAYAPWSTGGYHDEPWYVESIALQPVVSAPGTSPTPIPITPTPPTPVPKPVPPPERTDSMVCDVPGGGILTTRPDGTVDAFKCSFHGSMAGQTLSAPIVGICATASGKGYWLVGADGAIYAFGDAPYLGPLPAYFKAWNLGQGNAIPIIGIARGTTPGVGYYIIGDAGGPAADLYGILADGQFTHPPTGLYLKQHARRTELGVAA